MARTIRGINVVIGAETTGLGKALDDVNKKSRDIAAELRQVERGLRFNPKDTELLAQKQQLLAQQVEATREKLDRLRKVQSQVNEQFAKGEISEKAYREFQRELVETESKLRHFEKQLKETGFNLEQFGKKIGEAGKKMTDAGKQLSMKVTAPIVGLGAAVVKTGMDFEQSMSKVAAMSGASAEEMDQLEKAARDAGATTSKSAKEAADALGFMALAGWDVNTSMEGLMPVLRLSEAGNIDLAKASSLVTDSMSAMGIQVEDLGNYLDIVAQAARSSNTDIDQMAEAYIKVGGTLRGLDVELSESAIALGMLANAGIKGSEAGTGLNAVLLNLTAPTGRAKQALDELGYSAFDAEGNFKGLDTVLFDLKNMTEEMNAEQRNLTLSMIGGKEHVKTLNALLNGLDDSYGELSESILNADGALEDVAKTMQDNTKGSLVELMSALEELALKIFDVLQPALASVVESLQKFVDWLNNLSPEAQKTIVVIGGIAAAIGPLLIVLGAMASGLSAIIGILPVLGSLLAALISPIGLVVAAVAGLTFVWVKWGDDIKRVVSETFGKLTEWFGDFKDNTIRILSELPSRLLEIGKNLVTGLWEGITDRYEWVKNKLFGFVKGIGNVFTSFFKIRSPSGLTEEYGKMVAEGLAQGIERNAKKTGKAAKDMADTVSIHVEAIQGAVKKTVDGISTQTQIMEAKFGLWKAKFGETATESEHLRKELELQEGKMEQVNDRVEVLQKAYDDLRRVKGETAEETQKLYLELIKEKTAQAELQVEIEKTTQAYNKQANQIERMLRSGNVDDMIYAATYKQIEATGRVPSSVPSSGGLGEWAAKASQRREEEKRDADFQKALGKLLDAGVGIEEAHERVRHERRQAETQVNLNVGTLIADDYGLKQLERNLEKIRISEAQRVGG